MTFEKKKKVHDASTYLLGVLSELIHLKHGCTDRGTETKENHEVMERVSYRRATVAISRCRIPKQTCKPITSKLQLKKDAQMHHCS